MAGLLFDRLTEQGVAPNVANCAIQTAYQTADEQTLIEMGIATPTPEALAIVIQGARGLRHSAGGDRRRDRSAMA